MFDGILGIAGSILLPKSSPMAVECDRHRNGYCIDDGFTLPFGLSAINPIVEDFVTAVSSLLIRAPALVCVYTLIPAAFRYYKVTKSTKRYLGSMLPVIPAACFSLFIGGEVVLNPGHVYVATQFWLAGVLFMTTLTWTIWFFVLASAFKCRDTLPRLSPKISL